MLKITKWAQRNWKENMKTYKPSYILNFQKHLFIKK